MSEAFVRTALVEPRPAPAAATRSLWGRLLGLVNTPTNAALTLLALAVLYLLVPGAIDFLFIRASWSGGVETCRLPDSGACWPFIARRIGQFIYGFYPEEQRWRVNIAFALFAVVVVVAHTAPRSIRAWVGLGLVLAYPVVSGILLRGGILGLEGVNTRQWGGLIVTFVIGCVGILASFPIGVLLALGRQSQLPAIRVVCTAFIELWRGVPLITVLFFSTRVLPLLLSPSLARQIPDLVSVLIGVSLFTSAYIAEVVRGALQVIPKGQSEAARALGLGYWHVNFLITLPQAIKIAVPGIVGIYIGLFKETTLVEIVGIFDLLGQIMLAAPDTAWTSAVTANTGFAFAAMVYFCVCYPLSVYSRNIERRLSASQAA